MAERLDNAASIPGCLSKVGLGLGLGILLHFTKMPGSTYIKYTRLMIIMIFPFIQACVSDNVTDALEPCKHN